MGIGIQDHMATNILARYMLLKQIDAGSASLPGHRDFLRSIELEHYIRKIPREGK